MTNEEYKKLSIDEFTKVAERYPDRHYTGLDLTPAMIEQARKKNIKVFISAGEGVKWIQWELMEAGLLTEDDIDGICGRKTVAAIIKYQQSCKITADGLAGKTTRKYLVAA